MKKNKKDALTNSLKALVTDPTLIKYPKGHNPDNFFIFSNEKDGLSLKSGNRRFLNFLNTANFIVHQVQFV